MGVLSGFRSVKYFIRGELEVLTVLHVGSGEGDDRTDACVVKVRDANGHLKPVIPGSSMKGALRSHVERVALSLGLNACLLDSTSGSNCLSVNREKQNEARQRLEGGESLTDVLKDYELCVTCSLFGSPFCASKVLIRDLFPASPLPEVLPIRDGVGIDRDTGTARYGIKFDYEYLPPGTKFVFDMMVEDPQEMDLPLLCVGLREMELGNISLGGNSTRGAGRCRLSVEKIESLDMKDSQKYLEYLLCRKMEPVVNVKEFFDKNIEKLSGNLRG